MSPDFETLSKTLSQTGKISRRDFVTGLVGLTVLGLEKPAESAVGLFEPFSFAYVTDVHLCVGKSDTFKMLRESQLFLQDLIKSINAQSVDFTVFGGDQVESPGKNESNWQLFLDIVQGLESPWSFVLGESDVQGNVDKMKTYGPDWRGRNIETTTPYWSLQPLPGVHIIGLDTSRSSLNAGQMSQEQIDWLKKELETHQRRFIIVFSHHPVLPPAPFDGGAPWDDYILAQGPSVREILNSSRYVKLAVSGHVHVSKVQREKDIWYVASPSLAVYPCAYRVFHVTPDSITIETYQVSFPALIKNARKALAGSPFAFDYNSTNPELFVELAEGDKLDQNALLPQAPGAVPQPLPKKKKEKKPKPAKDKKQKPGKEKAEKGKKADQQKDQKKDNSKKDSESETEELKTEQKEEQQSSKDQKNEKPAVKEKPADDKESNTSESGQNAEADNKKPDQSSNMKSEPKEDAGSDSGK